MSLQKPPKLVPGTRIATVSASWGGPGAIPHRYEVGKRQLMEQFQVEVVEMPHTLHPPDWLARHPEARAEDLMAAFADPSIDGIISTIGGDDSIRLLRYLDLDVIRRNPKVYMGYSDTTVTHFACYRAGLVSFYGPSIMSGFAENCGMFPYMADSVERTLFSVEPVGEIAPNPDGWTVEFLDWADPANQARRRTLQPTSGWRWLQGEGVARGHLLGGCLEVVEWLRGTAVWPSLDQWDGAILFLESSEQAPPPATLSTALRSYAALGILERLAGILLARPGGDVPPENFADYDAALLQVVAEEEGLRHLPVVTQMDFGHTDPFFVLPYGVQAEIDCVTRRFSILESAVS
jgi:muramoyltetrapeptide carboxypeptidase LdcA involved in peptidoglycan recycling